VLVPETSKFAAFHPDVTAILVNAVFTVDRTTELLAIDVLYVLIATIVIVYWVDETNPFTVAGELVIPVCTTVVPLVGTAVAVYDVTIPEGGVNV